MGSGNAVALRELLEYIVSLSEETVMIKTDPALIRPVDAPFICCGRSLTGEKLGREPEYHIMIRFGT